VATNHPPADDGVTTAPRSAFGAEFVGAAGFLNSATYGVPPTFLVGALQDRIADWQAGTMDVPAFDESVRRGRAAYAALVGVGAGSVTMGGSVSALLGLVAAAVPDGARVATLTGEFTSTTFPFAAQAARGVAVTEMTAAELIASAASYDVVVASLVQSADGAVLDVEGLRTALADADTVTVLDVTQAVGWKVLDLGWVDVTAAAVYKWLLAPRGTAWMSVSDRVSRLMTPHLANWYAGEAPWSTIYGLPLRLAEDGRRFDTSPAWFSVLGAGLTMPWLAALDRNAADGHCLGLATRLRTAFGLPAMDSAIVSLPMAGAAERLAGAGIRASVRAGAVRVGFHLYNTDDDLQRLLDALAG
jgi:selenocysteine lyase/cysteine desulfurase